MIGHGSPPILPPMTQGSIDDDLREVLAGVIAAQATLVGLLVQHRILAPAETAARYADLCDRFGPNGNGGAAARVILQSIRDRGLIAPSPDPTWLRGVIDGGRVDRGPTGASGE